MNILLHGINISTQFQTCIHQLIQAFEEKGSNVKLTKNLFNSFRKKGNLSPIVTPLNAKNDLSAIDVVISIGGDGTLLDTISLIGAYEIPVLGINTGRMGFLATIAKEDIIAAVKDLLERVYYPQERHLFDDYGTYLYRW